MFENGQKALPGPGCPPITGRVRWLPTTLCGKVVAEGNYAA